MAAANSQLLAANCSFINNTAAAQGGGMFLEEVAAFVAGAVFFNNEAGSGAGVYQAMRDCEAHLHHFPYCRDLSCSSSE